MSEELHVLLQNESQSIDCSLNPNSDYDKSTFAFNCQQMLILPAEMTLSQIWSASWTLAPKVDQKHSMDVFYITRNKAL